MLAGGQSVIPLMKLRFAAPHALVDINRVEGLDGLREQAGGLRLGALVRHRDCERSELLRGRFGVLGDAAPREIVVATLGGPVRWRHSRATASGVAPDTQAASRDCCDHEVQPLAP